MGHAQPAKENQQLILRTQLGDGVVDKYVRAIVTTDSGAVLAGSPFTIPHVNNGKHLLKPSGLTFPVGTIEEVYSQYEVYEDAGFTQKSCHGVDMDVWYKDASATVVVDDILEKTCQILNVIGSIVPGAELVACIEVDDELCAVIEVDELCGVIEVVELCGVVEISDEIVAHIETDSELIGLVEDDNA